MNFPTRKALLSIFVNTLIFAAGLIIAQFEAVPDGWTVLIVAGLKALQQILARYTSTGGETPAKRLA